MGTAKTTIATTAPATITAPITAIMAANPPTPSVPNERLEEPEGGEEGEEVGEPPVGDGVPLGVTVMGESGEEVLGVLGEFGEPLLGAEGGPIGMMRTGDGGCDGGVDAVGVMESPKSTVRAVPEEDEQSQVTLDESVLVVQPEVVQVWVAESYVAQDAAVGAELVLNVVSDEVLTSASLFAFNDRLEAGIPFSVSYALESSTTVSTETKPSVAFAGKFGYVPL